MLLITVLTVPILLIAGFAYLLFILLKKRKFVLSLMTLIAPFVAYNGFLFYWYSRLIPQEIEISYPISAGEESGFREGCGVAVFKVSRKTLDAIQRDGLAFFATAAHGRAYQDSSSHEYFYNTYDAWKETPLPETASDEDSLFMCSVISTDLEHQIYTAAKKNGSYYAHKQEGKILVIPSLGYVVFSSYG